MGRYLENRRPTLLWLAVVASTNSCYFFDFFKSSSATGGAGAVDMSPVLGRSLGAKAGGVDEAALQALYAVTTDRPPAPIRPDPDLYARRLLLQYREEGSTIARQIGAIERYRPMLGGASQDFIQKPQEEYDATSLLATYKVAESICTGLVDPNESSHPGWQTVLPAAPASWRENIVFLAQRFIGKPSENIDESIITALKGVLDSGTPSGNYTNHSYVPVCATLSLDAEALFL